MLKSKKQRRIYSEDFKREAVLSYENSTKTCAEICQFLDISCESVLRRWCVIYGQKTSKRKSMQQPKSGKVVSIKEKLQLSKIEETARILALEEENCSLRQALGTHAVKAYLAELREESWREMTNPEIAKEVDKIVAKKR